MDHDKKGFTSHKDNDNSDPLGWNNDYYLEQPQDELEKMRQAQIKAAVREPRYEEMPTEQLIEIYNHRLDVEAEALDLILSKMEDESVGEEELNELQRKQFIYHEVTQNIRDILIERGIEVKRIE